MPGLYDQYFSKSAYRKLEKLFEKLTQASKDKENFSSQDIKKAQNQSEKLQKEYIDLMQKDRSTAQNLNSHYEKQLFKLDDLIEMHTKGIDDGLYHYRKYVVQTLQIHDYLEYFKEIASKAKHTSNTKQFYRELAETYLHLEARVDAALGYEDIFYDFYESDARIKGSIDDYFSKCKIKIEQKIPATLNSSVYKTRFGKVNELIRKHIIHKYPLDLKLLQDHITYLRKHHVDYSPKGIKADNDLMKNKYWEGAPRKSIYNKRQQKEALSKANGRIRNRIITVHSQAIANDKKSLEQLHENNKKHSKVIRKAKTALRKKNGPIKVAHNIATQMSELYDDFSKLIMGVNADNTPILEEGIEGFTNFMKKQAAMFEKELLKGHNLLNQIRRLSPRYFAMMLDYFETDPNVAKQEWLKVYKEKNGIKAPTNKKFKSEDAFKEFKAKRRIEQGRMPREYSLSQDQSDYYYPKAEKVEKRIAENSRHWNTQTLDDAAFVKSDQVWNEAIDKSKLVRNFRLKKCNFKKPDIDTINELGMKNNTFKARREQMSRGFKGMQISKHNISSFNYLGYNNKSSTMKPYGFSENVNISIPDHVRSSSRTSYMHNNFKVYRQYRPVSTNITGDYTLKSNNKAITTKDKIRSFKNKIRHKADIALNGHNGMKTRLERTRARLAKPIITLEFSKGSKVGMCTGIFFLYLPSSWAASTASGQIVKYVSPEASETVRKVSEFAAVQFAVGLTDFVAYKAAHYFIHKKAAHSLVNIFLTRLVGNATMARFILTNQVAAIALMAAWEAGYWVGSKIEKNKTVQKYATAVFFPLFPAPSGFEYVYDNKAQCWTVTRTSAKIFEDLQTVTLTDEEKKFLIYWQDPIYRKLFVTHYDFIQKMSIGDLDNYIPTEEINIKDLQISYNTSGTGHHLQIDPSNLWRTLSVPKVNDLDFDLITMEERLKIKNRKNLKKSVIFIRQSGHMNKTAIHPNYVPTFDELANLDKYLKLRSKDADKAETYRLMNPFLRKKQQFSYSYDTSFLEAQTVKLDRQLTKVKSESSYLVLLNSRSKFTYYLTKATYIMQYLITGKSRTKTDGGMRELRALQDIISDDAHEYWIGKGKKKTAQAINLINSHFQFLDNFIVLVDRNAQKRLKKHNTLYKNSIRAMKKYAEKYMKTLQKLGDEKIKKIENILPNIKASIVVNFRIIRSKSARKALKNDIKNLRQPYMERKRRIKMLNKQINKNLDLLSKR